MMGPVAYERLVRPLLFSLEPETAHHVALASLRLTVAFPPLLAALRHFQPPRKPLKLFGFEFPNPVGLAAGFDKNGVALPAWEALGFGFVEIGTVTAKPQPGNPTPRIFRYPEQEALINRLGFNNDGADAVADRLGRLRTSGRWPKIPIGINLGKSRATEVTHAADDYLYSLSRVRDFADYLVLNVSSPNTPGLRSLQEYQALRDLLRAIRAENGSAGKPILVKVAPDLPLPELNSLLSVCEENGVDGIVATNTTLNHSAVPAAQDQTGGLSGRPLREMSTALIRAIRVQSSLPIIGVGGICDAASASEKFEAGAQLVQVYTGFVYRGPGILTDIVSSLPAA